MRNIRCIGALMALLMVNACSTGPTAPPPTSPAVTPSDASDTASMSAEDAYRAWLEASREPDVDVACGYLSDELVERMIAEFQANYGTDPGGCAGLTELTAELYETLGQSAEVIIEVIEETETDALLFVTYIESRSCGTVALEKRNAGWIITEDSEGCSQP